MQLNRQQLRELRLVRKTFGVALVVIGVIGIVLPILPGWILIFIGLSLLGIEIYYVEKIKSYAKEKIKRKK